MEIGQSIQEARKKAKLTQKELAEKVGIATITVQQYERGVRTPKIETLQKIAQALNIDVGVLYGVEVNKGNPQYLNRLYGKISEVAEKYGRPEEEVVNWINRCLSMSDKYDMSEAVANRLEFLSGNMAKRVFEQVDSLSADEQLQMAEAVDLLTQFEKEERRYVLDTIGRLLLLNATGLIEAFKRVTELAMLEGYTKPISELADGSEDKR
ncbi:helix-turn-helix domain-containing protein [Faecalibacterium sp. CLA-AA-H283]|mgnify:FL=1|uniref:helix-turn-helix domain-containing protein n=1 Tax=Faecalibacterium TaxID=216851 RepID=UPI001D0EF2CA|nr:helix-turn-helix transcriptional regulator [Faecalibacterium hominis (ex Afrizal et al. 2022)]MCC2140065.1 helix-turn-helix domain-containing protein [Faecalibacterium hominis (ex Afrizal et al. 2022)]